MRVSLDLRRGGYSPWFVEVEMSKIIRRLEPGRRSLGGKVSTQMRGHVMGQYILAQYHPEMRGHVFICGGPIPPTFDVDVRRAARFDSIEEALLVRHAMPHQLGGNDQ